MATAAQVAARHPGAFNRIEDIFPLAVTAVANTDFAFSLPAGARNVVFRVNTVTAFGAATDAQLQIGKTAGGAEYVAAVTVKALQSLALTNVGTLAADLDAFPGALTARIVQTGAASATGQANLYVSYSLPL
jgi:hypothetical protein